VEKSFIIFNCLNLIAMKKIFFVAILYIFALAAPLNSSEYEHRNLATGGEMPGTVALQQGIGLADNLSPLCSEVVKTLVNFLDSNVHSGNN